MRYVGEICKFFLLQVLLSFNLSAQTVTTLSGYPVIDLSALNPLGAVLSSEDAVKRRDSMNLQTPYYDKFLGVGESVSGHNGTWNAKMSVKFQVMRANSTIGATDWVTAYNQCKSYDKEGGNAGQWRLPTQRELQMIWILHPQLIGKGGFIAFGTSYYWSATEGIVTNAWLVSFNRGSVLFTSGVVDDGNKTSRYVVRCVRDL